MSYRYITIQDTSIRATGYVQNIESYMPT